MNRRFNRKHPQIFNSGVRLFVLLAFTVGGLLWCDRFLRAQEADPDQPGQIGANRSASEVTAPAAGAARKKSGGILPNGPMDVLRGLGPFLYPQGLCSFVVVWFSLERMVVLRRGRVIPRHFVRRFFQSVRDGTLDPKSALQLCEDNGSPIAQVLAHGVRKWGKPSVEVEQAIIDGGERQVSVLRTHLRVINGAATIAPLIGLLGTVVGMIQAFDVISEKASQGKTEELAAGIGVALLTTAVGLLTAIPALIMYMYLCGVVDDLIFEMDSLGQELVDDISAEALADMSNVAKKGLARG